MKKIILSLIILSTLITSFIEYAFAQEELIYEEYLLPVMVDGNEREPLKAMCEFIRHYDNPIYAKRKSWRQYDNSDSWGVNTANKKLKTIGFSIIPSKKKYRYSPSFDLMKGDSIYIAGLSTFSFFFNDTTNQFIIITSIENLCGTPYMRDTIITNNLMKECPYSYGLGLFCFYKNGILLMHDEYREQSVLFWDIHNEKEAILLLKYKIKFEHPEFIHKNLIVKNTDWIFECEENVFVNGINIGKEKGYSKVFDYSYIDDKPFYFYEKDSLIYISYDDKSLPYEYKKVLHYLCCEPALLNPRSYNNMVWFYAQKEDENWYYVEMGRYK
jgi:hypothetical protein